MTADAAPDLVQALLHGGPPRASAAAEEQALLGEQAPEHTAGSICTCRLSNSRNPPAGPAV